MLGEEKMPESDQAQAIDPSGVAWDCLEDARLTWTWNKQAFPEPLTPLVQSYLPYHTQGWARAARAQGAPGAVHLRFEHGYFYSNWRPTGLTSWEAAEIAWQKAEQATPARWEQEWLPEIRADLERWGSIDLPALADDALAQHLQEVLARQIHLWEIHAHMGSAPVRAVGRLVDWYLGRFPGAPESEPYRLLQGQSNMSVESSRRLWELSREVTPEIRASLLAASWAQLPEPFGSHFRAYLGTYGQRTRAVADPASRTWREDPEPVARLILSYAESNVPDPYLEVERLAAERQAFTAEVRDGLAPGERETFDALLGCALANGPLTEDHAFWLDQRTTTAVRDICAEFERRLVKSGVLDRAEDIAYLRLDELVRWGFGLADPLRPRIAERKAEHQANRKITPPDFLGAPPAPQEWVDRYEGPPVPLKAKRGELRGAGASPGVVKGTARVAHSLEEGLALKRGEILVCAAADPNWTPLFALAAALVTDAGGSLCHAAVVAREYGIPAVVGTHSATRTIANGQIVEVDGVAGVVRLI
jgi:phosphohistidine swiveling domain-containing protein